MYDIYGVGAKIHLYCEMETSAVYTIILYYINYNYYLLQKTYRPYNNIVVSPHIVREVNNYSTKVVHKMTYNNKIFP